MTLEQKEAVKAETAACAARSKVERKLEDCKKDCEEAEKACFDLGLEWDSIDPFWKPKRTEP